MVTAAIHVVLVLPAVAGAGSSATTGGSPIPTKPKISRVDCLSACPSATSGRSAELRVAPGSTIRLTGTGFTDSDVVAFVGGATSRPALLTATTVDVVVPGDASSGTVVVLAGFGVRSGPSPVKLAVKGASGPISLGQPLPKSALMTSKFWEPRSYEMHPGVDLAISSGTPIKASGDGTVTTAAPSGGYGNYTCVRHTATVSTCYAHQSEILVSVGDRVRKGQVIGKVGCTGSCSGDHLHYEVRVSGAVVCPAAWVGASSKRWCESGSPGYGTRNVSAADLRRSRRGLTTRAAAAGFSARDARYFCPL